MGYGRQYALHTAITVTTTVATGALFYILRIVFYGHLTPEQYGLYFSLYAFAMLAQPLLSFGFDPGLVPYVTQFREERNSAALRAMALSCLAPQLLLTIVLALAVIALAPVVAEPVFGSPHATIIMYILIVHAALLVLVKSGQQILLGMQALGWRNGVDFVRAAVCLGAGFVLVRHSFGVEGAALAYLLAATGALVTQFVAVAVSFPNLWRGQPEWRPDLVTQVFRSGKYLSIAFGGVMVFSSLDTTLITLIRGNLREVAAYQIALPTVTIIYSLMTAAGLSFLPMARTLWFREERELLADGIGRIYEAAFVLMLPAGVLMAAFSDILMKVLFGPDILNAPEAFNLLAVGGVFYFVSYLNLHILAGIGQARGAAVAVGLALALDLLLDPALIHFFGIRGAAIASCIGYLTASSLGYYIIRKQLPVKAPVRAAVASALMCPCLWWIGQWVRTTSYFAQSPQLAALATGIGLFAAGIAILEAFGCAHMRQLASVLLPRRKGT